MVLIWDPSRSTLVDDTINEIAQGIKEGKIPPEISPSILTGLGEKFRKFYFASFRRVGRLDWSLKRFPATADDPSGFQSFVNELRERLGEGFLINTKRIVPMYVSHTENELARILDYSELYHEDELTRNEAIDSLKLDYNITISDSRLDFYFPSRNGKKASLEALISRLRQSKKQVEIDLTNTECVRGLIFEGMVGMHLMNRHGPENVEFQVRKPVFYNDLQGGRHREVYLDYVVEGQNIEVKLRNTLENILDSVLPQTFALSQEEETPVKSAVICRTRNPELDALYRENISLADEAEKMGINEAGRKIQDVFDYFILEELLDEDTNKDTHLEALQILDSFESTDTPAMKTYAKAFVRIQDNPEGLSDKYRILVNFMKERKVLSEDDLTDLFGEKKNPKISRDVTKRMEIIRDVARKRDYRLLVEMYNLHSQSTVTTLDDSAVSELYKLKSDDFTGLCRTVMEEKAQRKLSRKPKREVTSDDILEFHRRAYDRKTKEAMKLAKTTADIIEKRIDSICLPIYERAGLDIPNGVSYYKNELSIVANLLKKELDMSEKEIEKELLEIIENNHKNYSKVFDIMKKTSEHITEHMRDIRSSMIKDGRYSNDSLGNILVQFVKHFEDNKINFDDYRQGVLKDPVAKVANELVTKLRDKKLNVSKREREVLARFGLMIRGDLEEGVLDGNIIYFNAAKELSQISEFLSWGLFEDYACDVGHMDLSVFSPEKCPVIGGTDRHNRLFASRVYSSDKMIYGLISSFRSALNEQIEYYKYRGEYIRDIDKILHDPETQQKFSLDRHHFAMEYSSKMVGYCLPGLAGDLENNLTLLVEHDVDLNNETYARFIEYFAKKMSTYIPYSFDRASKDLILQETLTLEQKKEFFKRHTSEVIKKMAETNSFNYGMCSDYLSRKAYNMRVLTRFGDKVAEDYRCSNPVDKDKFDLPVEEFAAYIKELDTKDELLFKSFLTGANGYNHVTQAPIITA